MLPDYESKNDIYLTVVMPVLFSSSRENQNSSRGREKNIVDMTLAPFGVRTCLQQLNNSIMLTQLISISSSDRSDRGRALG